MTNSIVGSFVISKEGRWLEYDGSTNEFLDVYKNRPASIVGVNTMASEILVKWVGNELNNMSTYPFDAFTPLSIGQSRLLELLFDI